MRTRFSLTLLASALLLPVAVHAQALPPAQDIIDRHVQASGGRNAILARNSTKATGTFEMPAAGVKGDFVVYNAQPNKMLMTIEVPGLGSIRNGFDGEVAWSSDPMSGARILAGMELAAMQDQATELATVRDESLFTSRETVQKTEIEGVECYQVRMVWKSGRETLDCYSTETGLLAATSMSQESPMGAVDITILFRDYRQFGDLQLPTTTVQRLMGQEQMLRISNVEFDNVDPAVFELPPEIRARVPKAN